MNSITVMSNLHPSRAATSTQCLGTVQYSPHDMGPSLFYYLVFMLELPFKILSLCNHLSQIDCSVSKVVFWVAALSKL